MAELKLSNPNMDQKEIMTAVGKRWSEMKPAEKEVKFFLLNFMLI